MKQHNFSQYAGLNDGYMLRVKLKDEGVPLFGHIYSIGGLQPYQPAFTPNNAFSMFVLKDLGAYRRDKHLDNLLDRTVYANQVEVIEIIRL